jgi:hypothetical protein
MIEPSLAQALALSAILAGITGGCGPGAEPHPETVPVQGKVTYKGQPVPRGTITFQPDSGQPATGEIQSDGSYRLGTFSASDGAVLGHHRVMIIDNTADPTKIPGSSPGYVAPKDLVPRSYGQIDTSGLAVDVAKARTTYDFDLK